MYKIITFIKDIGIHIQLRAKVFMKDGMSVTVYIMALIVFAVIFRSLNMQAEEKASIPIGIVNYDFNGDGASEYSQQFINNLKELSSLYVYEGDFEEMKGMLNDGYINSLYVIEQGYHNKIKKGNNRKLITIYQSGKSNFAMLVSDIAAGEMMYQICLERGYAKYRKYSYGNDRHHTEQEYREYAELLKNSNDIDFGFLFTYKDSGRIIKDNGGINNSILYRQAIAGIAAMILSFILLFVITQNVMEKENDIYKRRKISLLHEASVSAANILSSLLISSILILSFTAGFVYYAAADISFLKIMYITFVFCSMIGIILEVLSRFINSVFWFQIVGSLMIIILGISGFLSVLDGVVIRDIGLAGIIPNAWFIDAVTKVLV